MLKGINQWCFPPDTPLKKVFKYSRKAGFDAVELNLNEQGHIGLTVDSTDEDLEQVIQAATSENIQLKSLSTALLWKYPLSSPDESVREKGRQIIEKMLRIASVIGMDTILVVPGEVTSKVSYDECYKRSQHALTKLIPLAEKYDVKIGIENVWNKFLLSPLEMAQYIDELNSEYIGVYFDVGNILQYGYPEQWIRILGKRIFKIHVKDFHQGIGNAHGFVNLLSGDVNWKAVMKEMREIGYEDTVVAELAPYALCDYTLAEDTARHLEVILNLKEKKDVHR